MNNLGAECLIDYLKACSLLIVLLSLMDVLAT